MHPEDALIVESLADVELIRQYEAVKRAPRTAWKDALLRELERRAERRGSVDDPDRGMSYLWDRASRSVLLDRRSKQVRGPVRGLSSRERLERERHRRLGATALQGSATTGTGRVIRDDKTQG